MNIYEKAAWCNRSKQVMRPGGLNLTKQLLTLAHLEKSARVLDLGCGLGSSTEQMRQLGYKTIGVDVSAKLIAQAKKNHPQCDLRIASADNLPFKSAFFEAVLCECSLSVFESLKALTEIKRVLCSGGRLLVSDLYKRRDVDLSYLESLSAHLYTKEQWHESLQDQGFGNFVWRECSDCFKDFIMQALWDDDGLISCADYEQLKRAKLGYFLLIGEKITVGEKL
ncbi:MAG: DVU_1556 family methyltransferase [Bacillota bacterium]|jgi:arsenite methyltransferase